MDYEKLCEVLPKQPVRWTTDDVLLWLQFINLEGLYPIFKKAAIDGSCLGHITEDDLRNELQIKSGITVKKLLTWINVGLKEYTAFLQQQAKGSQLHPMLTLARQYAIKPVQEPIDLPKIEIEKASPRLHLEKSISAPEAGRKERIELIIQQCDGSKGSYQHYISEEGGHIGRHSSNQVVILEESISRYHAKIECLNKAFFIRDIGSSTGTFIKLVEKTELKPAMIIEMGSNCFIINAIEPERIFMTIMDGNTEQTTDTWIPLKKDNRILIGRKPTNEINFPEDHHMSNCHAQIFWDEGKVYLLDLGTTNGTWLRLSPQGDTSQPHPLSNNTIFRLGTMQTYSCIRTISEVVQKPNSNSCNICRTVEKNCLYMPCKHIYACIACSQIKGECPICSSKITDYVRIFGC